MPPDQLLRQTFETCGDYCAARRMLETTPVARPVIFMLVGCRANERCVIERTETGFVTREDDTCAANDWVPRAAGLGRPHRHAAVSRQHIRRGDGLQPGAPRRAGELGRRIGGRPLRLGARAGAQSLYAACGRHVPRVGNSARRRLRSGRRCVAGAGDASLRHCAGDGLAAYFISAGCVTINASTTTQPRPSGSTLMGLRSISAIEAA